MVNDDQIIVPESWSIKENQKTNLCNWLCENGDSDDFEHFEIIFDMLDEILDSGPDISEDTVADSARSFNGSVIDGIAD